MPKKAKVDEGWRDHVTPALDEFFDKKLGPDIADDARRFCPKRTGALAESIEHHVENGNLIISATGSKEKEYAEYVEMGTHEHVIEAKGKALFWPGARHPVRRVTIPDIPAQPFLRPALFRERSSE